MELSPTDLAALASVALEAARNAGEMISGSRPADVQHKAGGLTLASQVVTEIDRAAEAIIVEALTPTLDRFELGLLTEETPDDGGRLTADYHWCVDPLDGTLAFIEGRPGYSVSIALVGRNGTPHIGVVYDPIDQTAYHAIAGSGLWRNGAPWSPALGDAGNHLSVLVTSAFAAADGYDERVARLNALAGTLGLDGARVDPGNGAVMKACRVLEQSPGCFVILPGPTGASLWDFAASACLFHEAGAVATTFAGQPLDLNRADETNMGNDGVLFASTVELANDVRSACAISE